jgi:hypothetical protein
VNREQKLEAVARLAVEGWARWELMHGAQEEILKIGEPMPSWPRDAFEAYLDALKTAAEDALADGGVP